MVPITPPNYEWLNNMRETPFNPKEFTILVLEGVLHIGLDDETTRKRH